MSAPDHTPFLLPTDLRTPEDVVRWQREAADRLWRQSYTVTTTDVLNATSEQIDRERRQACRRGMLRAFKFACGNRANERAWAKSDDAEDRHWAKWASKQRIVEVQRALAFRAAARA